MNDLYLEVVSCVSQSPFLLFATLFYEQCTFVYVSVWLMTVLSVVLCEMFDCFVDDNCDVHVYFSSRNKRFEKNYFFNIYLPYLHQKLLTGLVI